MKKEGQKMPSFDGQVENWDKWEIQWGAFCCSTVENTQWLINVV